jgi:hypothetical protein
VLSVSPLRACSKSPCDTSANGKYITLQPLIILFGGFTDPGIRSRI